MRETSKYTIATALASEMIRHNNKHITSDDAHTRRFGAQSILSIFEHAIDNGLTHALEEITVNQVREMVSAAIEELTDQDWQLYSSGLGIAMRYIREGM